jgi:predicted enzyme related to lactoylglutathione lyase
MPPKKLNASLAFVNVPSDNPAQSRDFFQQLFGIELAPSLSADEGYHAPISDDGIDLNINVRHTQQESPMPFIAVGNLDQAIELAENARGQVIWGPEELPIPDADLEDYKQGIKELENEDVQGNSMGRAAIVREPGGSQVGLVQLAEHAHRHFGVGKHQRPIDDHQVRVHERAMDVGRKRRR